MSSQTLEELYGTTASKDGLPLNEYNVSDLQPYYDEKEHKSTERKAKWVTELWIRGQLQYNQGVTIPATHQHLLTSKQLEKTSKESMIIRLMLEDQSYPELVDNQHSTWQDTEATKKCMGYIHHTLQSTALITNILALGINTQFVRLLKRKTTPKHCNTTPFHFPIQNSFNDEIEMKTMLMYKDLMEFQNTNLAVANTAMEEILERQIIKKKDGKDTTINITNTVKDVFRSYLNNAITYAKEFMKLATILTSRVYRGCRPSYPHCIYSGDSYHALYAIALSNYLFNYHIKKTTNTTPKQSVAQSLFTKSNEYVKKLDASCFGQISRAKHVPSSQAKEAVQGQTGTYFITIPGTLAGQEGDLKRKSKSGSTGKTITGNRIPKITGLGNTPYDVRHVQFANNDAIEKQKRIRDHAKGNRHLLIAPTRGTKIMLWTNINVFLFRHGPYVRHGLAMLFTFKLLPKEMLKQITIASLETGALYRISPNSKVGIDLIEYKKYPTVASMPDQVYNKYAMWIDRGAFLSDHEREIIFKTIPEDVTKLCSLDEYELEEGNYFITNGNSNIAKMSTKFSEISVSCWLPENSIWSNYYLTKTRDIISRLKYLVNPTRDCLLGTTQRQRVLYHEIKAFTSRTAQYPTFQTILHHLEAVRLWFSDEDHLKEMKYDDQTEGIFMLSDKIPEISHKKLLESLPLTKHPRDVWYLNMDSLLIGACKVPVNYIRIPTKYVIYENAHEADPKLLIGLNHVKGERQLLYTKANEIANNMPSIFVDITEVTRRFTQKKLQYVNSKHYLTGFEFDKKGNITKQPSDYTPSSYDRFDHGIKNPVTLTREDIYWDKRVKNPATVQAVVQQEEFDSSGDEVVENGNNGMSEEGLNPPQPAQLFGNYNAQPPMAQNPPQSVSLFGDYNPQIPMTQNQQMPNQLFEEYNPQYIQIKNETQPRRGLQIKRSEATKPKPVNQNRLTDNVDLDPLSCQIIPNTTVEYSNRTFNMIMIDNVAYWALLNKKRRSYQKVIDPRVIKALTKRAEREIERKKNFG